MPATNELLLEQIKDVETKLIVARTMGAVTTDLENQLRDLKEKFNRSNQALNESSVLKG